MKKNILIIGAGGHAKNIIECIDLERFSISGILDKDKSHLHENINGIEIIGTDEDIEHYYNSGITCAVIAIGHMGNGAIRNHLYTLLHHIGFELINIRHSTSYISPSAVLEDGIVVLPGAVINAEARIGANAIINTNSVIEHDVVIKNNVHIAPGTVISGGSVIGENSFIGAGSTVIQGVTIGENVIIGAGSVIIRDVPDNNKLAGVPARNIEVRA